MYPSLPHFHEVPAKSWPDRVARKKKIQLPKLSDAGIVFELVNDDSHLLQPTGISM